ncbi:MAG: alpha/beta fold hydrolase [Balneolaceae bacterium]|nr:alpha/beta fold hydrolase [Balneolaceae bacterium]
MMETNLTDISSFETPFWCFNGHVHTIARSFFGDSNKPLCQRIEIPTPDGDFLELDVINQKNKQPVIALFHGLEGSTDRYYIIEMMKELSARNYSVVAVNFRGCGSRLNNKMRFYHSGETQDYSTVFNWIAKTFPTQKRGAVGFSLGGNALLKFLAEQHEHKPDAAVAVSVPYNLKRGCLAISQGFNRIYEYRFMRTLRKKLNDKRECFPQLPTYSGSTLYRFDDEVTAPVHGFDDAEDYYAQCSSKKFIPFINVPSLLIHSRQDPLCPVDEMPVKKIKENSLTDYIITEEGGHVGFWSSPRGWLNQTIMNYFLNKFDS